MSDRSRIASGNELEDSFFLQEDRLLIEKLKALRKVEESRGALSRASGIQDVQVLDRLIELGVRPESVAALALVPIVEVAWADGSLDQKERQAVLDAAEAKGIRRGEIEHQLLESWLDRPPKPELIEAWEHYIAGLVPQLAAEQRQVLQRELLDRARAVAESSGGFLGIGQRVSPAEKAVLERLEQAFRA